MDGDLSSTATPPLEGCGPALADQLSLPKPLRQRVFEYVRGQGRTARSDISRALGISPGSATTLTADLIRANLIREVADPERGQGRGRPRVALEIVPEAGHVIGIKLGDDRHTAALSDFAGRLICDLTLPASTKARPSYQIVDEIGALLTGLLEKAGKTLRDVSGIGIGMVGIVDHAQGIVHWSPLLDSTDQAFGAAVEERFGLPVALENDANMLTLSELWFGAGRVKSDFAVVTLEKGVGMGLVLNNQLYRGSFGMGLELGHTKVQMEGALCRCGQRGCLEAYISDDALTREAATVLNLAPDTDGPASTMAALYQQAAAGHAPALRIFQRAGRFLALGLSNVVQLFDPALLILSGERMTYEFMYADHLSADVQALVLSQNKMPCKIEIRGHRDLHWARGATARALADMTDRLFNTETPA
ncbi:ROK family protein [Sulfitobacter noctilucae]|uniref:ROK family transcriptional regulator n=1 Tax=Sulfitobacter noctilucae TaxID=1342302 RepID=UPI000468D94D|nr:ROK family protein [Sulfitobacter noctilucae]KIN65552.1 ROK family protein [Sulfitobacter noctilucae]